LYTTLTFKDRIPKAIYPTYWPNSIDSVLHRFLPIPLPSHFLWPHYEKSTNLYLDSQISIPLLLLFSIVLGGVILSKKLKPTLNPVVMSCFLFVLSIYASLNRSHTNWIAKHAALAQFTMRFTTYANLALLSGLISLYLFYKPKLPSRKLLGVVLLVGFAAVSMKVWQANTRKYKLDTDNHEYFLSDQNKFLEKPAFGGYDYFTVSPYGLAIAESSEKARAKLLVFSPGINEHFGQLNSVSLDLQAPQWYQTNLSVFPWNNPKIDGVPFELGQTRQDGNALMILIPSGMHIITPEFQPPKVWKVLRFLSFLSLVFWVILLVFQIPSGRTHFILAVTRRYRGNG
jgi:hypothetical protein